MNALLIVLLETSTQRTPGERNGAVVIIAVVVAIIFLLLRGRR